MNKKGRAAARLARHALLRTRDYFTWRTELRRLTDQGHPAKLQIGCGPNRLPGWFNTDSYLFTFGVHYLDATKPFPFPDGSFRFVFTEHQIEHITIHQARGMLRECFRILQPGGRIRIATPSLLFVTSLKRPALSADEAGYVEFAAQFIRPDVGLRTPALAINSVFYEHGHRFIYDFETLASLLQEAGFTDVQERRPGESDSPELRGIENHAKPMGSDVFNRLETIVVEAVRT